MNREPTSPNSQTNEHDEQEALQRMICEGLAPIALPAADAAGLRSRLLQRVGRSARRHAGLITVRVGDGSWRRLIKGVRSKLLHAGVDGASVLIELAAGRPARRCRGTATSISRRASSCAGHCNSAS